MSRGEISGTDTRRESLLKYYFRNGTYIVPAVILGYVVDESCAKLQASFKIRPVIMIIIQLTLIIFVLYFCERLLVQRLKNKTDSKIPVILSSTIYFFLQETLLKNLLLIKRSLSFVRKH
jgi:sulfite exporter TauE/SafE